MMKRRILGPAGWRRSRRQLLRDLGLGAACLPLLGAERARAAPATPRLLIVASINGYRMADWQPPDGPLSAPLPRTTSPLEPHKGDLVVLHDLSNPAFDGCRTCGRYSYGTVYYGLPARGMSSTYASAGGPTVDQVVAHGIGARSFSAGVQLLLPPISPPAATQCFWTGPGQPVTCELDPVRAYSFAFGARATPAPDPTVKQLLGQRRSILDYVAGSLNRFRAGLGADDREAMDAHFNGLRAIERQLGSCAAAAKPDLPANYLEDYGSYFPILQAFHGLIVALFACGITRVATLQLANAVGDNVDFGAFVPGIPARGSGYQLPFRSWKDLGRNPVLGGVDHKQIVDQWWMGWLADLISDLKSRADATTGRRLFDDTLILWGNDMHDGGDEDPQRLPWILAGSCNGYFKTGQCLGGNSTTTVLADICQAMGVATHPYGATTPGLKA